VTGTPPPRAVYLCDGAVPVFGFFHASVTPAPGGLAVLICPPFGWDEICSYRSRRDWASDLAKAGFPTLRIDFPGTGDSGGAPRDRAQLASWTAAVDAAARHLRRATGLDRVAAIGIGLGGLVACRALFEGAPIEELVLWGVPSRGRALIRELSVFASLEDSSIGAVSEEELPPPPLPGHYVWAGGFVLNAETVGDLEGLDLAELQLPEGGPRRALLLDRDGISVDARLESHLRDSGLAVDVASGEGYGAMIAKPHHARCPVAVFARVRSWLERAPGDALQEASAQTSTDPGDLAERHDSIELAVGEATIRETPLTVRQPFGELFGILTEPAHGLTHELCAVMLNAGAIRRVGPNRMWVETARRWAARGVPTLRLDLQGIGDADGDSERFSELAELYVPELVDQVCATLEELQRRGVASRFVLAGLCSGAYWSFHAALRDERVVAAFMLNPQALFWDPSLEAARDFRRGVMRTSSWRRVLRGEVSPERILALAYRAPFALPRRWAARRQARRHGEDELQDALDRLRDTGKYVHFAFSGNEPLHEELERDGYLQRLDRWPNVSLEFIPGRVHTLRPFESQRHAHELLDRALEDMLQRTAGKHALNATSG